MGSNLDLRKLQDSEDLHKAFSLFVSGGKPGYRTIIEKSKPIIRCQGCGRVLTGDEKFCPECGTKVN